jgi:membrane-bound ClpP family serine protease
MIVEARAGIMDSLASWIFLIVTLLGVGYFLFSIIFGELTDGIADGEFGTLLIAAFAAGFGAFGLLGSLSGWSLPVTVLFSIGFGIVAGLLVRWLLRLLMRQQTEGSISGMEALIGLTGRVTIDSPAGKTGEAMLEGAQHVTRSAVKEVSGAALKRGDVVQVVNVESGLLYVKKKNG